MISLRVSIYAPHANRIQSAWLTLQVTTRTGDGPETAVLVATEGADNLSQHGMLNEVGFNSSGESFAIRYARFFPSRNDHEYCFSSNKSGFQGLYWQTASKSVKIDELLSSDCTSTRCRYRINHPHQRIPNTKPEMIQFSCPNCNSVAKARIESAGKKGKCSKCGTIFIIPNHSVKDVARPTSSDRGLPPAMSPRMPLAYEEPSLITNGGFSQTYSTIPNSTAVQINVSGSASNSLGITSLVLGILSLFTCWIPIIGLLIGGVSLALGVAAIVVAMKRNGSGVGYGIGGVTLGGITVLGSIAVISALVMSPELNRSSIDRLVNNSELSPTIGFAKYRSRKWNSLTYQTTFTYVRNNVWAERYYDGRLVRQLDEVSSNDEFLELREQDRGLVVRVYPDRQEFMDQGQWKWVATGQWESL